MNYLSIGAGNISRNKRRTLSTLIAIIIGVGMIVFVSGFNNALTGDWASGLIDGSEGHFKLQHKDYDNFATTDVEKILMEKPSEFINSLKENPHIVGAMPRLRFGGLLGQEDKSTVFFGSSTDINLRDSVIPGNGDILVEGKNLIPNDPNGALLGRLLAESLNVGVGDELVILGNSVYSEQSAVVVYVRGLVSIPGAAEIERMLLITDIENIQNDLLDVGEGATELVVRIDDIKNLEEVISWVNNHFKERGQPFVAVPWYSDKMFQQVTGMFKGIGLVISIVLSLIVGIIISNAQMMSIFERVKEIGTIRAIGAEKKHIYKLFYTEALLTTTAGVVFGLIFGFILIYLSGKTGISIPGGGGEPVEIYPVFESASAISATIVPLVVAFFAVLLPIKSSCKMNVIDALNYR